MKPGVSTQQKIPSTGKNLGEIPNGDCKKVSLKTLDTSSQLSSQFSSELNSNFTMAFVWHTHGGHSRPYRGFVVIWRNSGKYTAAAWVGDPNHSFTLIHDDWLMKSSRLGKVTGDRAGKPKAVVLGCADVFKARGLQHPGACASQIVPPQLEPQCMCLLTQG